MNCRTKYTHSMLKNWNSLEWYDRLIVCLFVHLLSIWQLSAFQVFQVNFEPAAIGKTISTVAAELLDKNPMAEVLSCIVLHSTPANRQKLTKLAKKILYSNNSPDISTIRSLFKVRVTGKFISWTFNDSIPILRFFDIWKYPIQAFATNIGPRYKMQSCQIHRNKRCTSYPDSVTVTCTSITIWTERIDTFRLNVLWSNCWSTTLTMGSVLCYRQSSPKRHRSFWVMVTHPETNTFFPNSLSRKSKRCKNSSPFSIVCNWLAAFK